jgi:hypothetical protein
LNEDQLCKKNQDHLLGRIERIVRIQNSLIEELGKDLTDFHENNDYGEHCLGLIPNYVDESILHKRLEYSLDQHENNAVRLRELFETAQEMYSNLIR